MFNNYILFAFLAGLFTFSITALGSLLVILFKSKQLNLLIGISAGIMLSASFFSLLEPAIEYTTNNNLNIWIFIILGFSIGCLFIYICDELIDYISNKRYPHLSNIKGSIMLFSSITIHNIPEGLLLGVAYSSIANNNSFASAIALTIAIAIQNFPEGSAISIPFRKNGFSKFISFLFGSLSAIVEPIFSLIGALLVIKIQTILPFIMSFSAGAMIFVTILELIPESFSYKNNNISTLFIIIGFMIMMILELII